MFYKLYEGQEEIIDAYGEPNRKPAIDLWGFEVGISMYFPE